MKDNFSKQAQSYSIYRPLYPANLYDFILGLVKNRETAWDCATGNGQVASYISDYFQKVYASDISQSQLNFAIHKPNIEYLISSAEKTPFADNSFDLINVAQAVHWFNFDSFYNEVNRVAKPHALLAIWGYGLISVDSRINEIIQKFYTEIVGKYWDNERKHIDHAYKTIPFPFKEINSPPFAIELSWSLKDFEGYLNTWSSVQKFVSQENYNPIPEVISTLKSFWKEGEIKKITFPIFMKASSINK